MTILPAIPLPENTAAFSGFKLRISVQLADIVAIGGTETGAIQVPIPAGKLVKRAGVNLITPLTNVTGASSAYALSLGFTSGGTTWGNAIVVDGNGSFVTLNQVAAVANTLGAAGTGSGASGTAWTLYIYLTTGSATTGYTLANTNAGAFDVYLDIDNLIDIGTNKDFP